MLFYSYFKTLVGKEVRHTGRQAGREQPGSPHAHACPALEHLHAALEAMSTHVQRTAPTAAPHTTPCPPRR